MKRMIAFAAAAMIASSVFASEEKVLKPGEKAPELTVSKWVKGEKVEKYKEDQVYVVEFWATWCGPCKTSIPHLTKLQKEYGDKVQVIGVSVWENGDDIPGQVQKFVDGYGDKMDYRVAIDMYTDPTDRNSGIMSQTWMKAAKRNGIPSAFVLKGDKVMWIGHPMSMDKALSEVVNGTFDLDASKADYDKYVAEIMESERFQARLAALQTAFAAGKQDFVSQEIDSILDQKDAGKKLEMVNNFAMVAYQESKSPEGDKKYGLFVAEKVLKVSQEPVVAYYASAAYEANGKHQKAVEILEKALATFEASEAAKSENMKGFAEALKSRIAVAKKSAADSGSGN